MNQAIEANKANEANETENLTQRTKLTKLTKGSKAFSSGSSALNWHHQFAIKPVVVLKEEWHTCMCIIGKEIFWCMLQMNDEALCPPEKLNARFR